MRPFFTILATLLLSIPISLTANHGCGSAKAFLGIHSDNVSKQKAEILNFENRYGSFITRVYEESAAADAGLQPFDYVFGIDDLRTERDKNLTCLLKEFDPDETATLHLVRQGKTMTKRVTFRDRSDTRKKEWNDQEKAFLGVDQNCNDCYSQNQRAVGVAVEIVANSTAQSMGLQDGDKIVSINNNKIIDWTDITAAMNMLQAGDNITVEYERNGQVSKVSQTVRSRAESGNRNYNYNYNYNHNNKNSHHDYAYLGIHTKDLSKSKAAKLDYDNPYGEVVSKVLTNTAAERAGLEVFDYIYGIDEYRMGAEQSLRTILKKYRPDEKAELMIYRKGKKRALPVTFGKKDYNDDHDYDYDECEDPFLGVRKEYDSNNRDGVAVNIVNNSTAEAIEMRNGDVVTQINGYRILDWTDLSMAINMLKVGEQIEVTVERDGNTLTQRGKIKSECDTKERYGYYGDDDRDDEWEDRLENRMERMGDDLEKMGEEIGEAVEEAMENLFDGERRDSDSDDDDTYDYDADERDWYEQERDRRRTEARSDMDLDNVEVDMEDMEEPEMRDLVNRADIDMPQNRSLSVNQLNLSPNPNMGMFELTFDLPSMGDTRIRIFNSVGRMIYEYELSAFSGDFSDPIDISQNGPGTYFLIVEQNGQAMTKKIILTSN